MCSGSSPPFPVLAGNKCQCCIEFRVMLRVELHFYRPQRSYGKVMFLYLSVILSTGECLLRCMLEYTHPPGRHTPHPLGSHPLPWADTHPSPADTNPWADTPPRQTPPSRWLLQWTVRILLECIIVGGIFLHLVWNFTANCMSIPHFCMKLI